MRSGHVIVAVMAEEKRAKAIGGENFLEGKLLIALPGMSV
jgi:hypothetical protein